MNSILSVLSRAFAQSDFDDIVFLRVEQKAETHICERVICFELITIIQVNYTCHTEVRYNSLLAFLHHIVSKEKFLNIFHSMNIWASSLVIDDCFECFHSRFDQ
jgi:hypothetical protein